MPISNWSTTASSNATADSASGISWPEGMSPAQVNDSARAMMAETRKWYDAEKNRAYAEFATYSGVSQVIPLDDTIPQITEGVQIASVSITPTSTTNKLRITVTGNAAATTSAGAHVMAAVFTGTANARATTHAYTTQSAPCNLVLVHEYTPGATTAITVTLRIGTSTAANTFAVNGITTALFGGSEKWTLTVEEIQA